MLRNSIEHTAKINVGAGYDIKSYDFLLNDKKQINKFIEVKAVSDVELKFYWSKNEINTAKLFRNKYYLYLLPVIKSGKFDFSKLKMIQNPYNKVFKNKGWNKIVEEYLISNKNI